MGWSTTDALPLVGPGWIRSGSTIPVGLSSPATSAFRTSPFRRTMSE